MNSILEKLYNGEKLTVEEFRTVLDAQTPELAEELAKRADEVRRQHYGNTVFVRGLIEFTNICRNNCLYCGIRRGQRDVERYRLTEEEILECADAGYELGYRTIVLQGGENPAVTQEFVESLIRKIKNAHPDCALTLSLGEWTREAYETWFKAGADRYLLRHETADKEHYMKLHPAEMSFEHRMNCLKELKEIGYQVGAGMMVGSPFQTTKELAEDLFFIQEFRPHMVGLGPFIPAKGTPFENEKAGTLEQTLFLLSIVRLIHPKVLLPATTALGTIHPRGREMGICAGANVVMPNLSPREVRDKYMLYDNKICTGEAATECRSCLERRMESVGYKVVVSRGDYND